ncbi:uncharacterized protein [Amphiura filiformis]|uniref:uncharacterized protein n=1 Tax=Amphiura filiformis TaxID=82378 RepID=UPI003B22474D
MKVFSILAGVFIVTWTGVNGRIFRAPEYVVPDNPVEHECVRECKWPPEPKTCRYVFTVEWLQSLSAACYDCPFNMTDCDRPGCIPINGVQRPIVTVNRQIPGPPIEVCEDDDIEVKVWNRLGNSEGTTIHWHGIHQRDTQYMDGAAMITQCPISAQSSFTYNFKASPAGTRWWHSHSNQQRQDGAFGAFIIKQAPERDVQSALYDYDLSEHVVFLQDWHHEPTVSNVAAFPPRTNDQDAMIINGKGVFVEFSKDGEIAYTPREVFNVEKGKRYRFRVIGNNVCHVFIHAQDHNLTVIATDGNPIKPIVVDRIGLVSGERYDFVLTADKDVGNYWFRLATTEGACAAVQEDFAILRYDGAPEEEPSEPYLDDGDEGVYLNPKSEFENPDAPDLDQIDAVTTDERIYGEPDVRYYMAVAVGINTVSRWGMYDPKDYPNPELTDFARATRQLNYVSFKRPPSPLLSQLDDVPKEDFCDADETLAARDDCINQYCTCTQMIKVDLGQLVEIVFVAEDFFGADHPMHFHGYNFRVVAIGKLPRGTTVDDVIQLDQQGNITRKLENAVEKDTVQVQGDGYTIIRFKAGNPGWWLLHCHKIFHIADGMTIAVQVGEQSDLPPVPEDFPRCGSWSPEGDEAGYEKERKNGASVKRGEKTRKKSDAE